MVGIGGGIKIECARFHRFRFVGLTIAAVCMKLDLLNG